MARTVADCALLENVMAGPHPSDIASLRPKLRIPAKLSGIEGWRIALSRDLGGFRIDRDVARNLDAAADAFREAGAVVEEVDLGWDHREIIEAARIHLRLDLRRGARGRGSTAPRPRDAVRGRVRRGCRSGIEQGTSSAASSSRPAYTSVWAGSSSATGC